MRVFLPLDKQGHSVMDSSVSTLPNSYSGFLSRREAYSMEKGKSHHGWSE